MPDDYPECEWCGGTIELGEPGVVNSKYHWHEGCADKVSSLLLYAEPIEPSPNDRSAG